MKILLELSFVGSAYCGWQVQKNGVSVQQRVQDAAEAVWGHRLPVTGCSRTDSGVHAEMFCCTVSGENIGNIPLERVPDALNRCLPSDIAVRRACLVEDSFHPRYDVIAKEYRYLIWNRRQKNPFSAGRAYHIPKPLDIEAMRDAASSLVGRHDFRAFMASGSSVEDTVREIYHADVREDAGYGKGYVMIAVEGNGFLYNMVRIISGTLLLAGEHKLDRRGMDAIIEGKRRDAAGKTLPACGLYLHRVRYPEGILSFRGEEH